MLLADRNISRLVFIKVFVDVQLQLCISTSSWSDGFSLDTVGSYGCVRCPANNMDFLVTETLSVSLANEKLSGSLKLSVD